MVEFIVLALMDKERVYELLWNFRYISIGIFIDINILATLFIYLQLQLTDFYQFSSHPVLTLKTTNPTFLLCLFQ